MRAKHLLMLSALAGFQFTANAQHLEWGKAMAGESPTQIFAMNTTVGPSGSVYASGFMIGSANFDPGASNFSITEENPSPFIVKRASDGEFLWARTFSSDHETHYGNTVVDTDGNSYTFGLFTGGLDCDPGPDEHLITSGTSRSYFLVKLDDDGNFVWAQQFGKLDTYVTSGQIVLQDDMIYCAGVYSDTADFDNGPDVHELTTSDVGSLFVMKLSTDGEFQWVTGFGATNNTIMAMEGTGDIAADASGVFLTGFFSSEGDFNPGAGVTTLSPTGDGDSFLLKLDADGEFEWAINSGGDDNEAALGIALGPDGSIYQCGVNVMTDVIPSPNEDIFIARYSSTGTVIWSHQIGGMYMEQATGIDVDENGAVYVSGDYSSANVDFDPGAGQYLLSAVTNEGYILKLTADGDFAGIASFETTVENVISPTAVVDVDYNGGKLYASGYFFNEVDLDPGTDEYLLTNSSDYANSYIMKLDTAAVILGQNESVLVPFQLYPNPTGSTAKLQLEQLGSGSSLTVINLQGERVLEQQLKALVTAIDLQQLPSGTYMVEIRQDGLKSTRRLVKM